MLPSLDYQMVSRRIQHFISDRVKEAKANGIIIGLSGGIDSTVTAHLAAATLPKEKVIGLILPVNKITPKKEVEDAKETAMHLGINIKYVDISNILNSYMMHLEKGSLAEGNLIARIRMSLLFYYANLTNRLVMGTSDRSEILIGYFTKYGDGGSDLLPIGGLYKTQVRELGRYIGVPEKIIEKASSPHLWTNHFAESDIGFPYEIIDRILYLWKDRRIDLDEVSHIIGNSEAVQSVFKMNQKSQHKREFPKICVLSDFE
jgi:NAD+ synthase